MSVPNECPVVDCSRRLDQPQKMPGCRVVALFWVRPDNGNCCPNNCIVSPSMQERNVHLSAFVKRLNDRLHQRPRTSTIRRLIQRRCGIGFGAISFPPFRDRRHAPPPSAMFVFDVVLSGNVTTPKSKVACDWLVGGV